MKNFKTIDCWLSFFMVLGFPILGLSTGNENYFMGYFLVGGWQIISMVVHALSGWFTNKGSRRNIYHRIVLITLSVWAISFIYIPLLFLILYLMLVAGPVMAVYYTWLCFYELKAMHQRPLAMLK